MVLGEAVQETDDGGGGGGGEDMVNLAMIKGEGRRR